MKLTLSNITSGYLPITTINANSTAIANAIENTLSRDGTSPNTMLANLDMNSFKVINLAVPTNAADAVRLLDLQNASISEVPLPSQTGNAGKHLITNGTVYSWSNVITATSGTLTGITNLIATGGSITGITDITVADGGTGASTAAGARTNLGLGTLAIQDATGLSVTDAALITGSADTTKKVRFEVDGVTTATTRVINVPDRDLTLGGVLTTEQASTSGTSIDFTGIPSGTRRIKVLFKGVSLDAITPVLIQLGNAGGIETSGYLSANFAGHNSTAGFVVAFLGVAQTIYGSYLLDLEKASTFSWVGGGNVFLSAGAADSGGGGKSLSAELDRIRITSVSGTANFDAGAVSISYE